MANGQVTVGAERLGVQSAEICGVVAVPRQVLVSLPEGGELGFFEKGSSGIAKLSSEDVVKRALRSLLGPLQLPRRVEVEFDAPASSKRLEVLDLPIAVGVLAAMGRLPAAALEKLKETLVVGAIAGSGEVTAVRGGAPDGVARQAARVEAGAGAAVQ